MSINEKHLKSSIPPISFFMDGVKVTIYEVLKGAWGWYHILVGFEYHAGGKIIKSRRFSLDVENIDELRAKLLVEISKFKLALMMRMEGVVT